MIFKIFGALFAVAGLMGCASLSGPKYPEPDQISRLLPADAILLGEQHDAPDHQLIHRFMVETLAGTGKLAALAIEMASEGQSTESLAPDASEDAVKTALRWGEGAWSWAVYGPVVMAAVRSGVPVFGANLPKSRLREAMADPGFEMLLPAPALLAQQQSIRLGHCDLLPESQVAPMARVQIARDIAMARTLVKLAQLARPDQTVLMLAGGTHVDRARGVPQHLPTTWTVRTVLLHGNEIAPAAKDDSVFDQFWRTRPAPPVDHCAEFKAYRAKPTDASPPKKAS